MRHIDLPIIVKEEPRIIKSLWQFLDLPRSFRFGRSTEKTTFVKGDEKQVECPVAVPETGRPLPVTVPVAAVQIIARTEVKPLDGIAAVLPVYQIIGLENRYAGEDKHGCSNHVVGGIDQNDIRI